MKISLNKIDKAQEGKMFHSILYCAYKDIGQTKYGDSFIKLTLKDATGSIDGKLWENCTHFDQKFDEGDIVTIKALPGIYRKKLFLNVNFIDKYTSSRHEVYGQNNLIPSLTIDTSQSWKEVRAYLKKTDYYQDFIQKIYQDCKSKILKYPYHVRPDLQKEGAYIYNLLKALKICDSMLKDVGSSEKCDLAIVYTLIFLKRLSVIACYEKEGIYKIKNETSLKGEKNTFYHFMNKYKNSIDRENYFLIQKYLDSEKSIQHSFEIGLVERIFKMIDYATF